MPATGTVTLIFSIKIEGLSGDTGVLDGELEDGVPDRFAGEAIGFAIAGGTLR